MTDGWYWLATARACGAVLVRAGHIADGCPYFRKAFLGKRPAEVRGEWVALPAVQTVLDL